MAPMSNPLVAKCSANSLAPIPRHPAAQPEATRKCVTALDGDGVPLFPSPLSRPKAPLGLRRADIGDVRDGMGSGNRLSKVNIHAMIAGSLRAATLVICVFTTFTTSAPFLTSFVATGAPLLTSLHSGSLSLRV